MGCCICTKAEKRADESREYICSLCVCKLMGMESEQRRELIDKLYLAGQTLAAEFVEKFSTGSIGTVKVIEQKLKVRVNAYKGLKSRIQ